MSTRSSTAVRRRRGPRRAFDVDRVIDAALALLDEGGPAALSVRAVAARLGVNPNAVYTYVADRAALERGIVERILGDAGPARLAREGASWRERLVAYARSIRRSLLRHPGAVPLLMTAPMTGPTALAVGERLLEAFALAGLDHDEAAQATYLVIVYVIGFVALEVAETDGRPPLPPESARVEARRAALGEGDPAYPRTAATVEVMARWTTTHQFEWGLNRLLDGLER